MTDTGTELEPRADEEELAERRSEELAEHPERLPLLPGEVKPHPSPRQYVLIGVILAIVTALEVAAYYVEDDVEDWIIVLALMVFMVLKFVIVAAWYMHLRTDKPMFNKLFAGGIVAALVLYLVVLATLRLF